MSMVEDLLLSWEREGAGEKTLTASVLQAQGKWTEKATEILAVVGGVEGRLSWLAELIAASEDSLLCRDGNHWLPILLHHLKGASDPASLQCVCRAVSALLTRIHLSPQVLKEFPSRYLPSLLSSLLGLVHGGVATQCTVLPVIAQLLYLFPGTHLKDQTLASLKMWANEGLLSESLHLSQECSRLLVVLYSEERTDLLHSVVSGLHWALSQLYQPVLGGGWEGGGGVGSLSFFPIPKQEPHRSGFLLRLVTALGRTLIYCLTFSPGCVGTCVAVPVARILGVVFLGLAVQQHQVTGQSTEVLLLGGVLQVLHTAVWNVLTATIKCCSSHVFPYCATIDACLLRGVTSGRTPLAVHRALCAWVSERKDCNHSFASAVFTTLLETTPADEMAEQLSSVKVMIAVVKSAGPSLYTPVAQLVWKFPLGRLSSSPPPPPPLTVALLDLLLVCATSTVTSLTPPLPKTLHIFKAHCTHPSIEVRQLAREGLHQLTLIQHPTVLPLVTAPLENHPANVPSTVPLENHPANVPSTVPLENHPANVPSTVPLENHPANVPSTVPHENHSANVPSTVPLENHPANVPSTVPLENHPANVPSTVPHENHSANVPSTVPHPPTVPLENHPANVPSTVPHENHPANVPSTVPHENHSANVPSTIPHENHPANFPPTVPHDSHPAIFPPTTPYELNPATSVSSGDGAEATELLAEESDSDDCIAMFVDLSPDQ